jgi:hypothetical protein
VTPFLEAHLQKACQSILVTAFTWDLVEKKRKKDRGVENSAVLLLPKEVNELNVISQQSGRGLFLEPPTPFQSPFPL